MSDLRKAAEMALEVMSKEPESFTLWVKDMRQAREALRQALALERFSEVNQEIEEALAQPEQESVECMCGICKLGKREWVGITKEDKKEILEMTQPDERGYVIAITEAKLKEKNT